MTNQRFMQTENPVVPNLGKEHKHNTTSAKINKQIEEFLSKGNKIKQIPIGVSGQKDVTKVSTGGRNPKSLTIHRRG